MAKELPFFKFEPSQWDNGNIQLCSFEAKGVFISVCSMYWQRLGDVPYKLAVQKICNGKATALDSLITEDVIKVIEGAICIDFLNEQLSEFENISHTNSENARSGWEKRRLKATAKRPQSNGNAIREDKIREDEMREDDFANWTKLIFEGNDQDFEQMLMKENFKLSAENFDFLCRDHLDLLSRYPKMQPNSQQKFRNSLMKHMRENHLKLAINGNGINKKQQSNYSTATYLADYYSKKSNQQ